MLARSFVSKRLKQRVRWDCNRVKRPCIGNVVNISLRLAANPAAGRHGADNLRRLEGLGLIRRVVPAAISNRGGDVEF